MSSRKLTSEEVDALMEGLQASDYAAHADVANSSDVRAFQFGQDDLSLMGDYYALRLINEKFARHARSVFLPMLRLQPRISPFPPEVKTFDEYCESIDNFMNLNISRMEELRGPMLLTLGPKFISTLTASFYGGSIYQADPKRTEFTSTEERVIELHGNGTYATCLSCGTRHELEPIKAAFEIDRSLPVCDQCGGIVKTATISFGQPMPKVAMNRARRETMACDLFLAVGSSLVVYPAAGFPEIAKRNNARLVIINRDPTGLDTIADLVLHREIGQTLGDAVRMN